MKKVHLPLCENDIQTLRAGESVQLFGTLYTARDAAHKKLCDMLNKGETLPIPRGCCIYYAGPCPAAPGEVIGPCGPTTSARMDAYTPQLIEYGVTGMIGKGPRNGQVQNCINSRAVYFAATGGAGVLIGSCVKSCELLAFAELGTEAVYKLEVEAMPVIVACDSAGGNLYERRSAFA